MSDSIYPAFFAPLMRWLHSFTLITDVCQLIGTHSLAAFPQRKLLGYIRAKAQLFPRSNNDIRCAQTAR
ncbi:Uncharacterised protein [Campylobacter jejuni]|nr:Uncharacterised protein [Campylobacter jejuni]